MSFPNLDLNLLRTFCVLMQERSVTRAAERMAVSQPVMSRALARLRRQLGDPLLVRGKGGMVPTPRAEAIHGPLHEALGRIDGAVTDSAAFDPTTSQRVFSLCTTDYVEALLLPPLMDRLRREAPGIDLRYVSPPADLLEALRAGQVDLAVMPPLHLADSTKTLALWDDRLVTVMRRDHPKARRALDLDTFTELGHVLVMITPGGAVRAVVDERLAALGRRRRIALTVTNFLVAPRVVAATDLLLTYPERLAKLAMKTLPLRIVEPPVELRPFRVYAGWHPRHDADPGHTYLRQAVAAVGRQVARNRSV